MIFTTKVAKAMTTPRIRHRSATDIRIPFCKVTADLPSSDH
ncbi:hypothetical protein SUS17_3979 [Sphingomonas sp. S17]|nr:hypothetical protein SUS17_3979 [Sphingomonas sp. S17]